MDLYGGASKWTSCSNEDFVGLLNATVSGGGGSCLQISKTNLITIINFSIRDRMAYRCTKKQMHREPDRKDQNSIIQTCIISL